VWHTVQPIGIELEGRLLTGRRAQRQPRPEKSECTIAQAIEEATTRSSLDVAKSKIQKSSGSGTALILCFRTPSGSVKLDNLWPTTPVSEVLRLLREKLGDQADALWWSIGPKPFDPDLLLSDYNVQSGLTVLGMLRVLGGSGPQTEQLQKAFQDLRLVRVSVKEISGNRGLYECCWPCAGGTSICNGLFDNICTSTGGCLHVWRTEMTGRGRCHGFTVVRPPPPPSRYAPAPPCPEIPECPPLWWIKHREDTLWAAWKEEEAEVQKQEKINYLKNKRLERANRLLARLAELKPGVDFVRTKATLGSLGAFVKFVPCACDAGRNRVGWIICGMDDKCRDLTGYCQDCNRLVVTCGSPISATRSKKTALQGLHCTATDHFKHFKCWACAIADLDLQAMNKIKDNEMRPNKEDQAYEDHLDQEEKKLAKQLQQERKTAQRKKIKTQATEISNAWYPGYTQYYLKVYEAWVLQCLERHDEWDRYFNLQEQVQARFGQSTGFLPPRQRPWFPELDPDFQDVDKHPLWKHLAQEDRNRFESLNLRLQQVGQSERCKRAREIAPPETPKKPQGRRFRGRSSTLESASTRATTYTSLLSSSPPGSSPGSPGVSRPSSAGISRISRQGSMQARYSRPSSASGAAMKQCVSEDIPNPPESAQVRPRRMSQERRRSQQLERRMTQEEFFKGPDVAQDQPRRLSQTWKP